MWQGSPCAASLRRADHQCTHQLGGSCPLTVVSTVSRALRRNCSVFRNGWQSVSLGYPRPVLCANPCWIQTHRHFLTDSNGTNTSSGVQFELIILINFLDRWGHDTPHLAQLPANAVQMQEPSARETSSTAFLPSVPLTPKQASWKSDFYRDILWGNSTQWPIKDLSFLRVPPHQVWPGSVGLGGPGPHS